MSMSTAESVSLESLVTHFEAYLSAIEQPSPLQGPAGYALTSGKRLRPLLTLVVAEMYSVPFSQSLPVAAALELIHNYSLIHDDLPAMDNDDLRRGLPTLHRRYDEATAILTGDYLFTYAFELLSSASAIPPATRLEIILLIAQSCGANGMVGGQFLDLNIANPSLAQLEDIYSKKTGALISASILSGAILGQAPYNERDRFAAIARQLGLAFQIADDLLDIENDQRPSYPSFLGLSESQRLLHSLFQTIEQQLLQFAHSTVMLRELVIKMVFRSS